MATGFRADTELVVVRDVVETAVLVGRNDEGGDIGDDVGVNEDDGDTVLVVFGSVEVVDSGRVEVDVVVVGSGCVVVVLDDVVEGSVVSGKLGCTVVGGSVLVVVVSSHVLIVLLGSGSVVVDEVVVSGSVDVVVDGSGCVVVVVLVVVVAAWVVGTTGETDVSRSYWTPDHQASGLPQHTPALSRYQPGCNSIEICDWRPNQSSFWARF